MNLNELRDQMLYENYPNNYIELCIDYAAFLQSNLVPIIFDTTHLSYLIGIDVCELYACYKQKEKTYNQIQIKKKTGGVRSINAPSENLKYIQRWILENILYQIPCSNYATGFVQNKSIVDNALNHVGKECVVNLDIKDFFPSINYIRVFKIFKEIGYSYHLAMMFTGFCTYNNYLPQGAPTSPYLSNLVCRNLDKRLSFLANKIGASYSRYADDITFSGDTDIRKYIGLIRRIIEEEQFAINEKKLRVQHKHHRQMVTGILVNSKLSVPADTKKYLRQQIYYCNKFGVDNSLIKQNVNKSNYKGHLYGLAYFIKMVEKDSGQSFLEDLKMIAWDC